MERVVETSNRTVFALDYLLYLNERVGSGETLPIIVNCTDIDFIKRNVPELVEMENDGRIKLQQIGGYQEKLI